MASQARLTLQNCILKGYFPTELVPGFTTKVLGNQINDIVSSLSGTSLTINGQPIRGSKCCIHTIPKIQHQRRTLSVPNPYHQIKVFETIIDNWTTIKSTINKSKYSLTKPIVHKDLKRAINRQHSFSEIPQKIPVLSSNSRYVLKTDISRYYPTIYTHSIPWACHGKSFAKRNRGAAHFGNVLDTNVRNTQDQQTIGIPIGPDSSYVISEIIGSVMDQEIHKELGINGLRYLDDYYFFLNTLSEAEEALTKIHKIAKQFELEINPEKTKIYPLPESLEFNWTSEIRNYEFHSSVKRQKTDLVTFFSKAFEYSKKHPNEYVLKYSLVRIKNVLIDKQNWELYESLILNSMIAEPSVIPTVLEIFLAYRNKGYNLNLNKIEKTINNNVGYHSKLGHGYEVAWSLWLAKSLNIKISRAAAKELSSVEDSFARITALDMRSIGLISTGLNVSEWNNYLSHEQLYQENWIFAYEAVKKGWLTSRSNYIASDTFFSILSSRNIEFYDSTLQVEPAKPSEVNNYPLSFSNGETRTQRGTKVVSSGGGGGY
ncbi:MAG: RNA-directed DNA polymerase [Bacillota bacterium]